MVLRGHGVGHAVEDPAQLVARLAQVRFGSSEPVVQARVVHGDSRSRAELLGKHEVTAVVDAARLGRGERDRADRAVAHGERHDHRRAEPEGAEQPQVLGISRDHLQE